MNRSLGRVLFTLLFIFFLPFYVYALSCTVTRVLDGDTFYCIPKERLTDVPIVKIHKDGSITVRLYGVDAPEKDQPYGEEAQNSLRELIKGRTVELEVKNIDKYGRIIALVYVNGVNINLEQVKRGYAWAYLEFLDRPYVSEFYLAEKEARSKSFGFWKQANPTPPWEWRKLKKKE
jgi:endonuclease YncB( thermonuclease family)